MTMTTTDIDGIIRKTLEELAYSYCFVSQNRWEKLKTDKEAKFFLRGRGLDKSEERSYWKFYRGQINTNQEEQ